MAYGSPIGVTLPVVGVTSDAVGEQLILDFLAAVDTVLSAKVTPAGIDINGNLSFRSGVTAYAATDVLKVNFSSQTTPLNAGTDPVAAYVSGGNLFYNDGSGNQIQMTSAGAVNVSSTGGITGSGYGTGGVEVNWDSVNVKYRMRSGAAADSYADVECDDIRLNDGSGNFLSLVAPAMSADYTVTFPAAVPAAQTIVQMGATGTLVASNTLASNQNLTLQGTGELKHGDVVVSVPSASAHNDTTGSISGTWTMQVNDGASGSGWVNPGGQVRLGFPLVLKVGDRIKSVSCELRDTSGANTIQMELWQNTAPDTAVQIGATQTSAGNGTNQTLTLSGLTQTVAAGEYYIVIINSTTTTTTLHKISGLNYTFDHP